MLEAGLDVRALKIRFGTGYQVADIDGAIAIRAEPGDHAMSIRHLGDVCLVTSF